MQQMRISMCFQWNSHIISSTWNNHYLFMGMGVEWGAGATPLSAEFWLSKGITLVTFCIIPWTKKTLSVCVCVYSNSCNDVPRVAQRYGTIAAHTQRRASILVFVVFCVHMYSFAGLIRQTPPPTFSDTAITDRHSDTTIFQLRAHWVQISWSIGSEKSFWYVPSVGVESSTSCVQGEHPIH